MREKRRDHYNRKGGYQIWLLSLCSVKKYNNRVGRSEVWFAEDISYHCAANPMSVQMPEVQKGYPPRDWASRIQTHGTLLKKPFGHTSNKWTKRFFLVKDGFLMYYADGEKKEYEKREFFNIHPKGIVPLGECQITPLQEPGHPFCLKLESHEIDGTLLLAFDTEHERNNWQEIMERSRRVTWRNTHLSAEMIRNLENEGLLMAREKQDYFDRLQTEAQALSEERLRADQLERINQELELEKKKLESFTADMQEEYDKLRVELEDTMQTMNDIEQERDKLNKTLQEQSCQLKSLADDKETVLKELSEHEAMASELSKEKRHLSETTDTLQQRLQEIEKQTELIKQEKKQAQERLRDQLERLHDLEEEKATISEHAQDLQSTIQDLKAQKEMTEKELREEIRARLSAEEQLKEAEISLKRLERAVQNQTPNIEADVKEEMAVNVKKLKQFFEELAADSKISSEKPLIIRNRLTARKTLARRAKTIKYETRRQSSKHRSTSCLDGESRPRQQLRRAVTSVAPCGRPALCLPASPRDKIVYEEDEHL